MSVYDMIIVFHHFLDWQHRHPFLIINLKNAAILHWLVHRWISIWTQAIIFIVPEPFSKLYQMQILRLVASLMPPNSMFNLLRFHFRSMTLYESPKLTMLLWIYWQMVTKKNQRAHLNSTFLFTNIFRQLNRIKNSYFNWTHESII